MTRNKIMLAIAGLSTVLLLLAVFELYLIFSFVAILFVLAIMATAGIERGGSELNISPYGKFIAGLGASFTVGMAFPWIGGGFDPTADSFTYVAGVPLSTVGVFLFIWLLPVFAGAFYFSYKIWPVTASVASIDSLIEEARNYQSERKYPLAALDRGDGD